MTELEKAARQALEALMRSKNAVSEDYDLASCAYGSVDPDGHRYQDAKKAVKSVKEAITALRRALEQPAAPVPQAHEWVGLTDIEIQNCFQPRSKDKTKERRLIAEQIVKKY